MAQVATLLAAPVLSRLLTPAQFGAFAVLLALESIILAGATLRFDHAVLIPRSVEVARVLFGSGLVALVSVVALSALLVMVVGDSIASSLGIPDHASVLWWLPPILLAEGLVGMLTHWSIREQSYGSVSVARGVQGVGTAGTQVGAAAASASPGALALGVVVGRALGLLALYAKIRHSIRGLRCAFRGLPVAAVLRAHRRFPLFATPGAIANSAGVHLPALLLTATFGPQVGGLYLFGMRVVEAPMILVGQAVSQVLLGEASSITRNGLTGPSELRRIAVRRLILLLALPFAMFAPAAPLLFQLVFGAEWYEAGIYVLILAPALIVRSVAAPLAALLVPLGRQREQALWDVARVLLVAGVIVFAAGEDWSPRAVIAALSGAQAFMYGVLLVMILTLGRRGDQPELRPQS